MAATGDLLAGRYRIEGTLGAGGMATVLQAHDVLLGRQVAVKILASNMAANPALLERFGREARAMATISHPNLVAVYDVGWTDEQAGQIPFLVMELVSGGTLAERLVADGPLAPPAVVELVEGLASALNALHGAGIVHRDVKPQNVLMAPAGPKLADLGVSRLYDPTDPAAASLTASGEMPGTLRFLAPEVIFGQAAGPAADAYALAMVAYEAITGRSPRPAVTLGDLVHGAWQPPTPVSEARPALGTAFDEAFAAGLDLDPSRRLDPQSFAAALWGALHAWVAQPRSDDATRGAGRQAPPAVPGDGAEAGAGEADTVVAPAATEAAAEGANDPGDAAVVVPASSDVETSAGLARLNPLAIPAGHSRLSPAADLADDDQGDDQADATGIAVLGSPGPRALAFVGLVILVAVAVVVGSIIGRPASPSAIGSTSSPSPVASSPSSPASPTPASTVDDTAAARQALEAVLAAIEAARGGRDGLKGGDANELVALVDDVRQALDRGDYAAARSAADRLAARAEKVSEKIDKKRREALLEAIDKLRAALEPA